MVEPLRFAVLGDPVSQSRSPAIHQEALRIAGLKGEFLAIKADEKALVKALEELRTGQFDGFNITMPLKEVAADLAGESGAINTLRCRDSRIEGFSSDTAAFRDILGSERFADAGTILILGTGGSALSALAAIEDKHVYISGRNEFRVAEIVTSSDRMVAVPWGAGVAGAIVINCTPLGMNSEHLPELVVEVGGALIDLPYGPSQTPAIAMALESRIPVVDGYEFLARQAASSFEWWTDVAVDFKPLAEIARNV